MPFKLSILALGMSASPLMAMTTLLCSGSTTFSEGSEEFMLELYLDWSEPKVYRRMPNGEQIGAPVISQDSNTITAGPFEYREYAAFLKENAWSSEKIVINRLNLSYTSTVHVSGRYFSSSDDTDRWEKSGTCRVGKPQI
jgi:hypothetical protein